MHARASSSSSSRSMGKLMSSSRSRSSSSRGRAAETPPARPARPDLAAALTGRRVARGGPTVQRRACTARIRYTGELCPKRAVWVPASRCGF